MVRRPGQRQRPRRHGRDSQVAHGDPPLPEGTRPDEVEEAFSQLGSACAELGVTLVGGHTEITYGLSRPLAVGAMLGEVEKGREVLTSGARPGDSIVLTKGIAIEGAAVLARESAPDLERAGVEQQVIDRAAELLFTPGISVARDARLAVQAADVHAMHDPTEGGLATGLLELATAAGVGLTVDLDRIPILDECRTICQALGSILWADRVWRSPRGPTAGRCPAARWGPGRRGHRGRRDRQDHPAGRRPQTPGRRWRAGPAPSSSATSSPAGSRTSIVAPAEAGAQGTGPPASSLLGPLVELSVGVEREPARTRRRRVPGACPACPHRRSS